eukprot:5609382-Amphidinium_carterae.1
MLPELDVWWFISEPSFAQVAALPAELAAAADAAVLVFSKSRAQETQVVQPFHLQRCCSEETYECL